uniref:RNA helicase n=1 Tax=Graphocephala atropunctata TaxID=36148 RepID=A0A1B6LUA3_9HEMI
MGKLRKSTLGWTPVHLNEAVLASGIEGLIGIEELTDYNLENNELQLPGKKKRKTVKTKPKALVMRPKKCISKPNICKKPTFTVEQIVEDTTNLESSEEQCHVNDLLISSSNDDSCSSELHQEDANLDIVPWSSLFVPTSVTKALMELGFKEPTEIQKLSIPPAIKGQRDILGAAETGSGKTF